MRSLHISRLLRFFAHVLAVDIDLTFWSALEYNWHVARSRVRQIQNVCVLRIPKNYICWLRWFFISLKNLSKKHFSNAILNFAWGSIYEHCKFLNQTAYEFWILKTYYIYIWSNDSYLICWKFEYDGLKLFRM